MTTKVLERLFGLKKAEELAAVRPDIEQAIAETRGNLAELKNRLTSAPFDSSKDEVEALRERIRETEEDLVMLEGVLQEAERRETAAAAMELESAVKSRRKAAQKHRDRLRDTFRAYDKLVENLDQMVKIFEECDSNLREFNAFAKANGHSELSLRNVGIIPANFKSVVDALRQSSVTHVFEHLEQTDRLDTPHAGLG